MIKQSLKHTKCPLLQKQQANSQFNYPFLFEQNCSEASSKGGQPYYFLDGQKTNPYSMQLIEKDTSTAKQSAFVPDTVAMNGNHYQRVRDCKVDHDEVKAQCMACNTQQMIPKNSAKFYCFSCKTLCICQPRQSRKQKQQKNAKFFICGCCSVKVKYLTGTSQLIRCPKCQTANRVPE